MKIDLIYVMKNDKTIESFKEVEHFEKFVLGVAEFDLDKWRIDMYLSDERHKDLVKNDAHFTKHWVEYLASFLRKHHMKTQILIEL